MRRSHHPRFAHPVLLAILLAMLLTAPGAAAAPADDVAAFLPPGVDYDPEVPSPAAVLGIRLGEWHLRHDQVVHYIEALAAASPRLTAETIGHSHEQRRLLLVTATDPAQHDRLDALREAHRRGDDDAPIVVWLGYGVHGDEASATHAAVVMLYHLAAARDEATRTLLREAIIIVDPCLNPDGHDRFTTWVNMHRGRQTVGDPQHREHRQGWPTGRTNHYWFDLNRDWLPVQHPESQARVAAFQRWKPHLLTDVHEMGRNSTYFFQPGVPSRQNPRTPASNIELTRRIAAYHAEALDTLGQLYYSEEIFDDYYYGKGSTYPDAQGSIGILFEQASARGHVQDTPDGPLTFATAIRNQVATSFSTLRAAYALQDDLRRYRADSQASAARAAAADPVKAFAFGDRRDPRRAAALADLIRRHDIAVYPLTADLALADDRRIDGGLTDDGQPAGYVVPLDQPQYRLIHALFEIHTAFEDTTFYDVSTWTMPLALHVPYAALDARAFAAARFDRDARVDADPAAPSDARPLAPATRDAAGRPVVAYALPWDGLEAPRALQRLHRLGARIRMATAPFTGVIHPGAAADAADSADADADATRAFAPGTLVVPLAVQTIDPDALHRTLETIAREDGLPVATLASGLTPGGIDLGSPSFVRLDAPRVALVVDRPINMYSAGSLWHLLDWRVGLPVTLLRADALPRADLDRYTHIV
ncbi:MAG: M14 family zinc carboxypeptidase, partial [Acidobacteriota bacterium]